MFPSRQAPEPSIATCGVVQTMCFQASNSEPYGQHQFINPVQFVVAEDFPVRFPLVVLSTLTGAPRGQVGCSHVLEIEGQEIARHDHPPLAVPCNGAGLSFRLTLEDVQVKQACTVIVKTRFSNSAVGQDITLRVASMEDVRERSGLAGKGTQA